MTPDASESSAYALDAGFGKLECKGFWTTLARDALGPAGAHGRDDAAESESQWRDLDEGSPTW